MQRIVSDLTTDKVGFIVLFVELILKQCMEWTSENIIVYKIEQGKLTMEELY